MQDLQHVVMAVFSAVALLIVTTHAAPPPAKKVPASAPGALTLSGLSAEQRQVLECRLTKVMAMRRALSVTNFSNDTVAPSVPIILFPPAGAKLNDTSTLVAGRARPGTAVHIKEDVTVRGTGTADETGLFQVPVALMVGSHTLAAVTEDVAGSLSPESSPVTVINALPSPTTPLVGVNRRIWLGSVRDFPDLFIPTVGQVNTVQIEGWLQMGTIENEHGNAGCNNSHRNCQTPQVHLRREVFQGTTRVMVASSEVPAQVVLTTGPNPHYLFSVSSGWDGQVSAGKFASAGPYVSKLTVWVSDKPLREPTSRALPELPPNCGPVAQPVNGPCTVDKIELLTTFGVFERVPRPPPKVEVGAGGLPKLENCASAGQVDGLACELVLHCGNCAPRPASSLCIGATCSDVPDGCGGVVICGRCP